MEVCSCGNVLDERKEITIIIRVCRCETPGPGRTEQRQRVPPVDLKQPSDPNRRRLGLPALTPLERGVIPRDKWCLHE